MKVWKDKSGKKIDAKEFSQRFKEGLTQITELQKTKSNIFGYVIIFIGMIWGLVITFKLRQWWLLTILCGSLFVSGTSFLGTMQRFIILSNIEKMAYAEPIEVSEVKND